MIPSCYTTQPGPEKVCVMYAHYMSPLTLMCFDTHVGLLKKTNKYVKKTIKKFVDGEYKVQCISNRKCKIWMKASNHRGMEGRKKVWYQLVADTVSASRNHLPIMRMVMTMILMMLINTMTQWVNWPNIRKTKKMLMFGTNTIQAQYRYNVNTKEEDDNVIWHNN